jgi:hypothetical protein
MVSRSSGPNILGMYRDLSTPTPCSPVIDPPASRHASRIWPDTSSAAAFCPGTASSYSTSGCRFPSPAWKTFATRIPADADRSAIRVSTAPSRVRGTTPSCTMNAGLIRPTAAKADLRPAHMTVRWAGSSAALISVAPAASQIARTTASSASTSAAGPSSSTMSTAPAPAG